MKLLLNDPLTFHRTSCAEGIPPLAESFFDSDERDREDMIPYLPTDLQFLHKVYIILLRALVAMGKTNLQSIKCDVRVLRSLINIFDSQLSSLAPSAPSDLGEYYAEHSRYTADQPRHAPTQLCTYPCDGFPLLCPSNESRCRRFLSILLTLRLYDRHCVRYDPDGQSSVCSPVLCGQDDLPRWIFYPQTCSKPTCSAPGSRCWRAGFLSGCTVSQERFHAAR